MFSGDCSITINNVDVGIDEGKADFPYLACNDMTRAIAGEWQCGVTSSNVSLQDSLVSSPARIVVQGKGHNHHNSFHVQLYLILAAPPSLVQLMLGEVDVTKSSLSVTENVNTLVTCVTRFSVPAPRLSWTLDNQPLESFNQTDAPEQTDVFKVRNP